MIIIFDTNDNTLSSDAGYNNILAEFSKEYKDALKSIIKEIFEFIDEYEENTAFRDSRNGIVADAAQEVTKKTFTFISGLVGSDKLEDAGEVCSVSVGYLCQLYLLSRTQSEEAMLSDAEWQVTILKLIIDRDFDPTFYDKNKKQCTADELKMIAAQIVKKCLTEIINKAGKSLNKVGHQKAKEMTIDAIVEAVHKNFFDNIISGMFANFLSDMSLAYLHSGNLGEKKKYTDSQKIIDLKNLASACAEETLNCFRRDGGYEKVLRNWRNITELSERFLKKLAFNRWKDNKIARFVTKNKKLECPFWDNSGSSDGTLIGLLRRSPVWTPEHGILLRVYDHKIGAEEKQGKYPHLILPTIEHNSDYHGGYRGCPETKGVGDSGKFCTISQLLDDAKNVNKIVKIPNENPCVLITSLRKIRAEIYYMRKNDFNKILEYLDSLAYYYKALFIPNVGQCVRLPSSYDVHFLNKEIIWINSLISPKSIPDNKQQDFSLATNRLAAIQKYIDTAHSLRSRYANEVLKNGIYKTVIRDESRMPIFYFLECIPHAEELMKILESREFDIDIKNFGKANMRNPSIIEAWKQKLSSVNNNQEEEVINSFGMSIIEALRNGLTVYDNADVLLVASYTTAKSKMNRMEMNLNRLLAYPQKHGLSAIMKVRKENSLVSILEKGINDDSDNIRIIDENDSIKNIHLTEVNNYLTENKPKPQPGSVGEVKIVVNYEDNEFVSVTRTLSEKYLADFYAQHLKCIFRVSSYAIHPVLILDQSESIYYHGFIECWKKEISTKINQKDSINKLYEKIGAIKEIGKIVCNLIFDDKNNYPEQIKQLLDFKDDFKGFIDTGLYFDSSIILDGINDYFQCLKNSYAKLDAPDNVPLNINNQEFTWGGVCYEDDPCLHYKMRIKIYTILEILKPDYKNGSTLLDPEAAQGIMELLEKNAVNDSHVHDNPARHCQELIDSIISMQEKSLELFESAHPAIQEIVCRKLTRYLKPKDQKKDLLEFITRIIKRCDIPQQGLLSMVSEYITFDRINAYCTRLGAGLKVLELSDYRSAITLDILSLLSSSCTSLQELTLRRAKHESRDVYPSQSFTLQSPSLLKLNISGHRRIKSFEFDAPTLKDLQFSGCNLQNLKGNSKSLEVLDLSGSNKIKLDNIVNQITQAPWLLNSVKLPESGESDVVSFRCNYPHMSGLELIGFKLEFISRILKNTEVMPEKWGGLTDKSKQALYLNICYRLDILRSVYAKVNRDENSILAARNKISKNKNNLVKSKLSGYFINNSVPKREQIEPQVASLTHHSGVRAIKFSAQDLMSISKDDDFNRFVADNFSQNDKTGDIIKNIYIQIAKLKEKDLCSTDKFIMKLKLQIFALELTNIKENNQNIVSANKASLFGGESKQHQLILDIVETLCSGLKDFSEPKKRSINSFLSYLMSCHVFHQLLAKDKESISKIFTAVYKRCVKKDTRKNGSTSAISDFDTIPDKFFKIFVIFTCGLMHYKDCSESIYNEYASLIRFIKISRKDLLEKVFNEVVSFFQVPATSTGQLNYAVKLLCLGQNLKDDTLKENLILSKNLRKKIEETYDRQLGDKSFHYDVNNIKLQETAAPDLRSI